MTLRRFLVALVFAPACAVSGQGAIGVPTTIEVPPPTATPKAGTAPTTADSSPARPPNSPPAPPAPPAEPPRADGLSVTVLTPGSGPAAQKGDHVRVHYVGTLVDGSQFDSSRTPNRGPFKFVLGQGHVIKGWEAGVLGMQVGEVRRLVIPPDMAYGDRGHPPVIPPGSTLIFEVELLGIDPP